MKSIRQLFFLTIAPILVSLLATSLMGQTEETQKEEPQHTVLQSKISGENQNKKKSSRRKNPNKTISFYFDNEDMIDIINFLASEKEVNVVLPIGANAINAKVTLHLEDKISVEEAWDILYTLLDIAGYSMVAKEETYNIVKTTKEVTREALPLYIVKPEEIPNTDKRIRYLYYFSNIKVSDDQSPTNEIFSILKDILPPDFASYKLDSQSNSLLITDKANDIRALMNIIVALDQVDPEKPEFIQLRYLSAKTVESLFKDLLQTAGDINQMRLGIRTPNNNTYFKKVRIVADERTNRLIVFGKPQAIERVRDFINNYIDVALESGKSVLHVYQLQYLDAGSFAPVLSRILKSEKTGGTEQSKAAAGTTAGGTERFFDEVIVVADQPKTISGEQPGGESKGSNNLIIAARNDDYERIKRLIEELDIPQPQVIIEVLIADLTIQDIVSLGANVRNPLGMGLPNNVNFQSAQTSDFLTNTVVNPSTIQADLLRTAFSQNGAIVSACDSPPSTTNPCFSAANFFSQGTTLFSFNDAATGQTWGIGQVRKFLDAAKVLHHPHVIATNNKKAEIKLEEQRLAIDQGSGSAGGTTTQTRRWIPATLSVEITPRISSADMVNLNVTINIEQFETPATDFTNTGANAANTANKLTRNVTTNANVRSGHILALGGLTRVDTAVQELETPLLAKIPVIGWFFKDRTNTTDKNNLTVFISPTVIQPRLRGGVGAYTKNHVQLAKSYSREGMLFENLRDPITRWFFKTQKDDAETDIDDFLAQDEFIAPTIFDVRQEARVVAQNKETTGKPVGTQQESQQKTTVIAAPSEQKLEKQEKQQTFIIAQPSTKKGEPKQDVPAKNTPTQDLKTLLADAENPFATPSVKA